MKEKYLVLPLMITFFTITAFAAPSPSRELFSQMLGGGFDFNLLPVAQKAVLANPALLGELSERNVSMFWMDLYSLGTSYNSYCASLPFGKQGIGFGIKCFDATDFLGFPYRESELLAGYGRKISEKISVGSTVSIFSSNIEGVEISGSAKGIGIDLGGTYAPTSQLNLQVVFRNALSYKKWSRKDPTGIYEYTEKSSPHIRMQLDYHYKQNLSFGISVNGLVGLATLATYRFEPHLELSAALTNQGLSVQLASLAKKMQVTYAYALHEVGKTNIISFGYSF